MEEIKFLDESYADEIFSIIKSHTKNVGVEKESITNLMLLKNLRLAITGATPNAAVAGFFRDGVLISFFHFYLVQGTPYWYVAYWSARKGNLHFNKNGIIQIWDYVCDFMEEQGIYNFYFARPDKYGITEKAQRNTKMHTRYNFQIEDVVEKGERSRFALFNQIVFNNCAASNKIVIIGAQLKPQYRTRFLEARERYGVSEFGKQLP